MKNRSKKIMALLLTGVMSAGLLAGCGGNSASNESQESAQEAAPAQEAGDAGAVEDEQQKLLRQNLQIVVRLLAKELRLHLYHS